MDRGGAWWIVVEPGGKWWNVVGRGRKMWMMQEIMEAR